MVFLLRVVVFSEELSVANFWWLFELETAGVLGGSMMMQINGGGCGGILGTKVAMVNLPVRLLRIQTVLLVLVGMLKYSKLASKQRVSNFSSHRIVPVLNTIKQWQQDIKLLALHAPKYKAMIQLAGSNDGQALAAYNSNCTS